MFNRIISRLLRFIRRSNDTTVRIKADFLPRPLTFKCESGIENFRTVRFGGEEAFLQQFIRSLKPDDIVWDVGSNIGLFGVAAATTIGGGHVYSFEPDPAIAARLLENISLNRLDNHEAIEVALSDSNGEFDLFTEGIHGFSPSLRQQSREGSPKDSVRVQASTGDAIITRGLAVSPTVLKVDVEGAEFQVLQGIQGLLESESRPRIIFMELHPNFLETFSSTVEECEEALVTRNYECISRQEREAEIQCIYKAV